MIRRFQYLYSFEQRFGFSIHPLLYFCLGKARRLKQAKEEAQDEIEKYRQEREKQFKEFEIKVNIKLYLVKVWFY